MFTKVEEAVIWMEQRRFITKGIDAFRSYMHTLNDPQDSIRSIHIGGTNGKGSTLDYLRAVLQCAGYRIGTFSSPYLETHFDRIRINDQYIDQTFFLDTVNAHYQEWIDHELNMFEIDFVMAALYFQAMQVDIAIYEVGLGGRRDATNVLKPILSIITNIGKDHMELLGDTYEKIAYEKAGIIKPHTPLITAEKKAECLRIFEDICRKKNSPLRLISQAYDIQSSSVLSFRYEQYCISLPHAPMYQIENIGCVLEAVQLLKQDHHIDIHDRQILQGLKNSHWKGRFEILQEDPIVIIDGAHNVEGIEALCASMKPYSDIHILFSALKDKHHDAMLEILSTISSDITVCEFDSYRAADSKDLAKQYPVVIEKDYHKAIDHALLKKGTILITGSLYFISDVRKYIKEILHKKTSH